MLNSPDTIRLISLISLTYFKPKLKRFSPASLHFNPRLDSGHIVMNTFQAGAWAQEEKLPLILIHGRKISVFAS
jgi:hypothetical protein